MQLKLISFSFALLFFALRLIAADESFEKNGFREDDLSLRFGTEHLIIIKLDYANKLQVLKTFINELLKNEIKNFCHWQMFPLNFEAHPRLRLGLKSVIDIETSQFRLNFHQVLIEVLLRNALIETIRDLTHEIYV